MSAAQCGLSSSSVPSRAKELILTGRNIDLPQALDWGLVNAVYPKSELEAGVSYWVEACWWLPHRLAVSYGKRVINDIVDHSSRLAD